MDVSFLFCRFGDGVGRRGGDVRAMVAMVVRLVGSPCRSTSVTVSTSPVVGSQVMLKGVPAVMEVRVVNVKGFCAEARAEKAASRRVVEKCIFSVACGKCLKRFRALK